MNKTVVLLVSAAVLAAAAVFISKSDGGASKQSSENGKPLLPGLPAALADGTVAAISISSDSGTATLELNGTEWSVKELFGYPADFDKIQRMSMSVADAVIGQTMPAMKIPQPGKTLSFLKADGTPAASLYFGGRRESKTASANPWEAGSGGIYVSREKNGTVFLTEDSFYEVSEAPVSWTDTGIFAEEPSGITSVTITHPDGDTVKLSANESGELMLEGKLKRKHEFDESKRYGLKSGLTRMKFTGIADPSLADDVTGLATAAVYTAETSAGEIFTAKIGAKAPGGTARYIRISVAAKDAAPEITAGDSAAEDGGKTNAERIAELNGRISPWTYLASDHAAALITPRRADLIKKIESK